VGETFGVVVWEGVFEGRHLERQEGVEVREGVKDGEQEEEGAHCAELSLIGGRHRTRARQRELGVAHGRAAPAEACSMGSQAQNRRTEEPTSREAATVPGSRRPNEPAS
jgi:hypothetical protein